MRENNQQQNYLKGTPVTKVYQVVVYHEVNDPEKLSAYAELAGPAMKSAGATFLARGIPYLVREEGTATRTVLIEWPSREAADTGYNSPGYQEAIRVLDGAARREFRYIDAL
tara:strand:+ start:1668 stop:2003 length:336 start_codon:yes stop_codon:yes gene_type:complete